MGRLSLKKRRLRGHCLALHSSLTGEWNRLEVGLCSQGTRNRTRGNALNLHQGKFRLYRMRFFSQKWLLSVRKGIFRELMKSLSLEVLKKQLDLSLSALVRLNRWYSVTGWT